MRMGWREGGHVWNPHRTPHLGLVVPQQRSEAVTVLDDVVLHTCSGGQLVFLEGIGAAMPCHNHTTGKQCSGMRGGLAAASHLPR